MQIGPDDFFHLTYCTKVHPGCGWEELLGNLRALVPQLKARLSPTRPFGLGLRLSNDESLELLAGDRLAEFQEFLAGITSTSSLSTASPTAPWRGSR